MTIVFATYSEGHIGHEVLAQRLARIWLCTTLRHTPSMMSTCSQSALWSLIVVEHSFPRLPKSALRIDGAMIACGAIMSCSRGRLVGCHGAQIRVVEDARTSSGIAMKFRYL